MSATHRVSMHGQVLGCCGFRVCCSRCANFSIQLPRSTRRENHMSLKRLFMPLFVVGIVLMMGSMAFAQTAVNCGLSVPGGSTVRATNTGHTEPIGAGTPTNAVLTPATAGGGTVR